MSGSNKTHKAPEASTSSTSAGLGTLDYRFLRILGEGTFGKVWFSHSLRDDKFCAVKIIRMRTQTGRDGLTSFEREVNCMERVEPNFPFIIQLIGHFTTPGHNFLVMEYIGGGDMQSLLEREGAIPERRARLYIAELGCALQHLHDRGIIHRDVKLENIVIGADGHLKLIDFGLSKIMTTSMTASVVGTPYTMAPEVLLQIRYDFRADWYSLGIVSYLMLSDEEVEYSSTYDDGWTEVDTLIHGTIVFPEELNEDCVAFLKRLLERCPNDRLACFQDLLDHPWFEGYTSEKVLSKDHEI